MNDHSSRPSSGGNFALFLILAFGVVLLHNMFFAPQRPPAPAEDDKQVAQAKGKPGQKPPEPPKAKPDKQPGPKAPGEPKAAPSEPAGQAEPDEKPAAKREGLKPGQLVPAVEPTRRYVTIGSADPESRYRMLVTFVDRGAAVVRIELNSPRYPTLTDEDGYLAHKGGYLGHVATDEDKQGKGCPVQVVGRGTPAERAGLKPGDLITKLAGTPVTGTASLKAALRRTKPGRKIEIEVLRDGKPNTLTATLTRPPMEVTRPEGLDRSVGPDPLSFLLTLAQVDEAVLPLPVVKADDPKDERPAYVGAELPGLALREGTWQIAECSEDAVTFRAELPQLGLELLKTYRLAEVPKEEQSNPDYRAYHLVLEVSIRNVDNDPHAVAYQLDGPTGLPIEGWWYANKVGLGNCWNVGLRDFIIARGVAGPKMVACPTIAKDNLEEIYTGEPVRFIGIDAQYFSAILIPVQDDSQEIGLAGTQPLRVGPVDKNNVRITDTSCRLWSTQRHLAPGETLTHRFEVFAGPKRPELLAQYGLDGLVTYGWFHWFAYVTVKILHGFQAVVHNWGLAILMLTVLVRGLMFPMSRKQALSMQKMAELQPEIKRIQEKYKKDLGGRQRAQSELFRKHNYNPLGGCLLMLVQFPIFIGLYRGLMVDIELRGSTLLGSGVRWCSNLAAPDMLFDWHRYMPEFVNSGIGMFGLGPYFNLLPLVTVILFLVQQKMFMPPPADEQQAMQQNIMKYMMLFMGILFFKVAAGLCLYFIASSLWGVAERKLLPKKPTADSDDASAGIFSAKPSRNGNPSTRQKKSRRRR